MEKIYYNAEFVTMTGLDAEDERTNQPEALWVRDGEIAGIGELDELSRYASDSAVRIDLKGKCMMPAFIDSHSHIVMNGQMCLCADLSECESYADIICTLKNYIRENSISKEGAVLGFGYDHNFLNEGSQPDKRVLNQVSEEIPIFIIHVSAHLACANSAALKLAGIDENTADPFGGKIGRMGDGQEPSGYLEEAGMNLVQKVIAGRLNFNIVEIMQKMQKVYIENGITTVQDGASTINDINFLSSINEAGKLKVDVIAYPLLTARGQETVKEYEKTIGEYKNHLKIGGYKLVLDGSPQGRSAWLSKPYLNEENYCGYPWLKDTEVNDYVLQAIKEGRQILAHCNGDAASEQFLNAYERAAAQIENARDLRPVMIHCQTVRNDQLDRMADLKMIASIFVGHVWYWGDVHMKNLGEERGHHISPVADAIKRGVIVNFHQDTPVTKPNMLHSIWCAVNRISKKGNTIGSEQKIPVYDALKAVTINAAYQYFEEDEKGTLEVGKKADLVILDKSPLSVPSLMIKDIKVMETIKDGETIYCRGED